MKDSMIIEGREFISSRRAAEIGKYSNDYIGQLCRGGKISARMIGRSWFVEQSSLTQYINSLNESKNHYVGRPETVEVPAVTNIPSYPKGAWTITYSSDDRPLLPALNKRPRSPLGSAELRPFGVSSIGRVVTHRNIYRRGARMVSRVSRIVPIALVMIGTVAFASVSAYSLLRSPSVHQALGNSVAYVQALEFFGAKENTASVWDSTKEWILNSWKKLFNLDQERDSLAESDIPNVTEPNLVTTEVVSEPLQPSNTFTLESSLPRVATVAAQYSSGESPRTYPVYSNTYLNMNDPALSLRIDALEERFNSVALRLTPQSDALAFIMGRAITDAVVASLNLGNANTWTALQTFSAGLDTDSLDVTGTSATSTFGAGIQATYLNVTGTAATSTFARGIELAGGCFAINGTCISGGGASLSGGIDNTFAYWTGASSLGVTTTPTVSALISTTTANSSFAGALGVGSTTPSWKLSVVGAGSFDDYVRASYFNATSTTATSTFTGSVRVSNQLGIGAAADTTRRLYISNDSTSSVTDRDGMVYSSSLSAPSANYTKNDLSIARSIVTAAASGLTNSGDLIQVSDTSTITVPSTGNYTITGNVLDLSRSHTIVGSNDTLTITGALATFSDNCTQTLGTCSSSADVLQLTQAYTSNSGSALNVTTAAGDSTGAYVLRVNDDGTLNDSTPFVIDPLGRTGVGTTSP